VAKEVMIIKYTNKTNHSITKFLELPFAGKYPKPISKSAKAAAAETAVTAGRGGSDSRRSHSRGDLRGGHASGC
jgi:hypothetical protein